MRTCQQGGGGGVAPCSIHYSSVNACCSTRVPMRTLCARPTWHPCSYNLDMEPWSYDEWREKHCQAWLDRRKPHTCQTPPTLPAAPPAAPVGCMHPTRSMLEAGEWDYDAFRDVHLESYLQMTETFMAEAQEQLNSA